MPASSLLGNGGRSFSGLKDCRAEAEVSFPPLQSQASGETHLESLHFPQASQNLLFYVEASCVYLDAEEGDGADSSADESELDAVGRRDGGRERRRGDRVDVVVRQRFGLGMRLGENCQGEERGESAKVREGRSESDSPAGMSSGLSW
jgi:hypothetical protein